MKALMILGSPRNKMNTAVLMDKVLEGLKKNKVVVETIELAKKKIYPCTACDTCTQTGKCIIEDDMEDLYSKLNKADIIVVGSPLYFNSVTAITKAMIDRCQAFWASKYVLKKPMIDVTKKRKGLFVCTAGSPQKTQGFIGGTMVMDLFFKAINTEYIGNLCVDNTDKVSVKDRPEILQQAVMIGQKLASKK